MVFHSETTELLKLNITLAINEHLIPLLHSFLAMHPLFQQMYLVAISVFIKK